MSRDFSGFSFLSVLYVYFPDGFIVRLVKVSHAWFFGLLTLIIMGQLVFFEGFRDAFLLLFLLFIGNMIKQLISEVTLCLSSFFSLQTMCKLEKITYILNIIVGQKFSRKVFFFPDRKQFNLALGEGCGGTRTVSTIQSHRLLLLGIEQQKLYYTQGQPSIFCEALRRAAATCQLRLAAGQM